MKNEPDTCPSNASVMAETPIFQGNIVPPTIEYMKELQAHIARLESEKEKQVSELEAFRKEKDEKAKKKNQMPVAIWRAYEHQSLAHALQKVPANAVNVEGFMWEKAPLKYLVESGLIETYTGRNDWRLTVLQQNNLTMEEYKNLLKDFGVDSFIRYEIGDCVYYIFIQSKCYSDNSWVTSKKISTSIVATLMARNTISNNIKMELIVYTSTKSIESRTRKFFEICNDPVRISYEFLEAPEVIDAPEEVPLQVPEEVPEPILVLREHQKQTVERFKAFYDSDAPRAQIRDAPGSGKTITMCSCVDTLSDEAVVFVVTDSTLLLKQLRKVFTIQLPRRAMTALKGKQSDSVLKPGVYFMTNQTLLLNKHLGRQAALVLVDEADGFCSPTSKLYKRLQAVPKVVFVSGTLREKTDDVIIGDFSASDSKEQRHTVPYEIYVPTVGATVDPELKKIFEDDDDVADESPEMSDSIEDESDAAARDSALEAIQDLVPSDVGEQCGLSQQQFKAVSTLSLMKEVGTNALVKYVSTKAHARLMARYIKRVGEKYYGMDIRVETVITVDDQNVKVNEKIMADFEQFLQNQTNRDDYFVIVACQMVQAGTNLPHLNSVSVSASSSFRAIMQCLMRACRAIEGKLRAYVLLNMATQKEIEKALALIYSAAESDETVVVKAFSPVPLITPETQERTVVLQHACNAAIERGVAKSKKYTIRHIDHLKAVLERASAFTDGKFPKDYDNKDDVDFLKHRTREWAQDYIGLLENAEHREVFEDFTKKFPKTYTEEYKASMKLTRLDEMKIVFNAFMDEVEELQKADKFPQIDSEVLFRLRHYDEQHKQTKYYNMSIFRYKELKKRYEVYRSKCPDELFSDNTRVANVLGVSRALSTTEKGKKALPHSTKHKELYEARVDIGNHWRAKTSMMTVPEEPAKNPNRELFEEFMKEYPGYYDEKWLKQDETKTSAAESLVGFLEGMLDAELPKPGDDVSHRLVGLARDSLKKKPPSKSDLHKEGVSDAWKALVEKRGDEMPWLKDPKKFDQLEIEHVIARVDDVIERTGDRPEQRTDQMFYKLVFQFEKEYHEKTGRFVEGPAREKFQEFVTKNKKIYLDEFWTALGTGHRSIEQSVYLAQRNLNMIEEWFKEHKDPPRQSKVTEAVEKKAGTIYGHFKRNWPTEGPFADKGFSQRFAAKMAEIRRKSPKLYDFKLPDAAPDTAPDAAPDAAPEASTSQ